MINKRGYTASFKFVGEVHLNEDSIKTDCMSSSGWKYNRLNFGVRCGDAGTHFVQAMSGYSTTKGGVLYVGLRTDGGFENRKIDWDDRFDEELVEAAMSPYRASVEKTQDGKPFVKKFLSAYDFIEYLEEHISDGDTISCRGDIEYSEYEGKTVTRYNVKSVTKIDGEAKTEASFIQTLLLNSDCIGDVDENGYTTINGFGIDYDRDARDNRAFPVSFKYKFPEDEKQARAQRKLIFNIKEGTVNEVTFLGEFVSSYPTVEATPEDLTDDVRELIELGLYSEEEVLTQYAGNGRPTRMAVITKPRIYTPKGGSPTVQIVENYCDESELYGTKVVDTKSPIADPMPGSDDDDDFDLSDLFE